MLSKLAPVWRAFANSLVGIGAVIFAAATDGSHTMHPLDPATLPRFFLVVCAMGAAMPHLILFPYWVIVGTHPFSRLLRFMQLLTRLSIALGVAMTFGVLAIAPLAIWWPLAGRVWFESAFLLGTAFGLYLMLRRWAEFIYWFEGWSTRGNARPYGARHTVLLNRIG